jgi:hypothetical protein
MLEGQFIAGVMLGYQETPWPTDSTKFNRRVGIKTGTYKDSFGQQHINTELIDVQYDDCEAVKAVCTLLAGKSVIVPVVAVARKGGKEGAWLSMFMPKGVKITEQVLPNGDGSKPIKSST